VALLCQKATCFALGLSNTGFGLGSKNAGLEPFAVFMPLRARCTNVVHDLGSAEPRSKVEPSSC